MIIGAVAGGSLGYSYAESKVTLYQAKTSLSLLQNSSVVNTQPGQTPQTIDTAADIQNQLVILNGNQLADQVRTTRKMPSNPSISATQLGQSNVVQIVASSPSKDDALAIAATTSSLYIHQRVAQLTAAVNGAVASLNAQAKVVKAGLAAATAANPPNATSTPTENALQSQYQQLLQQISALTTATPQIGRVVTVLSPPSPVSAALSAKSKDLVGGALLGALIGLALLLGLRRAIPRIRTVGDVASLELPVLLPVLTRRPRRAGRGSRAWRSSAGRLLAARLIAPGSMPSGPIIVVGATPGVGASFVAATLAAGLADRGPVLLVLASEAINGSKGRQLKTLPTRNAQRGLPGDGQAGVSDLIQRAIPSIVPGVWLLPCNSEFPEFRGAAPAARAAMLDDVLRRATAADWLAVVDAPALSDSDLALDCAASYGNTALVVGRGTSRPAEVLSAADLFDAHGSRFEGVILNDVPRRLLPRRRPQPTPTFSNAAPGQAPGSGQAAGSGLRPGMADALSATGSFDIVDSYASQDSYQSSLLRMEMPSAQPRTGGRRRAPSNGLRHGARGTQ